MKKVSILLLLSFFTAWMTTFTGCKKDGGMPTPEIPILRTAAVFNITTTSAASGGKVTFTGSAEVTASGVCWNTTHNPTIAESKNANGIGANLDTFEISLNGLTPNTTYYVRAYATNSAGTAYGNEISFTTVQVSLATLTTMEVTNISVASAASGGNITDNGGEDITEVGLCWGTAPNPTTSNSKTALAGSNTFGSLLNGLQPSTKYYVRAYATNSDGTAYGNELSFTTSAISPIIFNPDLTYGLVSDIEGNAYKTIQIGTQTWMAENLKTTKYNDGTSITNVTDLTEGGNIPIGDYCWYNFNASAFKSTYGALYNWYAVTDSRKLCPAGWHVPNSDEWNTLENYIGFNNNIDSKVKETGTTHWLEAVGGGSNESGFTALPGGIRDNQFVNLGYRGSWWSATSNDISGISADFYSTESIDIYDYLALTPRLQTSKASGISVRCVKNN